MLVHQVRRSPDEIVHKLREGWIVRYRVVVLHPSAGHPGGVSHVVADIVLSEALKLVPVGRDQPDHGMPHHHEACQLPGVGAELSHGLR